MLITADWVLPVSRPPIRNGGVIIDGTTVLEVGRGEELKGLARDREHFHFAGCTLLPGLVNAHTHLSLSAMEGLLEPEAFDLWLPKLVAAMRAWEPDDYAASAALGSYRSLEAGVTVVGDIVYGPEAVAVAADAGIGGVFYWEVLGVEGPRLYAELERMEFPLDDGTGCGARTRCGVSPHSTYTSGPSLLHAVHEAALELKVPVAVHVAESVAEAELLAEGAGPLLETANRLAKGFEPPHSGAVAYLDRLGVLDGVTAIHLGQALPTDIPRLAATARGIVTCPRSNLFLSNRTPRIHRMRLAGIPVGIGTDSAASNHDLDLFEEIRALQGLDTKLTARDLLEIATASGAIAIGVEDRYGILERGMQADVAVFKTGPTDTPEETLVRVGGRGTVEAVLARGEWRVLEGRCVRDVAPLAAGIAAATERARQAIAEAAV